MIFASIVAAFAMVGYAESKTKIIDAKIEQVTERGFVLKASVGSIPVEDDTHTKFWLKKMPTTRESFKVGDTVNARIKVDAATTVLREMSDPVSAAWLNRIRKEYVSAVVAKLDLSRVEVNFDDRASFSYAVSAKTKVTIGGEAKSISDLKPGSRVYVKAQLTPSLDTRATQITDKIAVTLKPTKGGLAAKRPKRIDNDGTLAGSVTSIPENLAIFDIQNDAGLFHISYTAQTKFTLAGLPSNPKAIRLGDTATCNYRRDSYGRIIAINVDLTRG